MLHWFREHFEDPANETPYSSEDGGYQYIWGGPYDAREQLSDEFGTMISEDLIADIAVELENDDIVDWAPGPKHPDHVRASDEAAADRYEDEAEELPDLAPIIHMLESGQQPNYGGEDEHRRRQQALDNIAALREALAPFRPIHGGVGHNNPPIDDDTPQTRTVEEIYKATSTIEEELKKDTPDALEVAKSTSKIKSLMGWLGARANAAVDKVIGGVMVDTLMGSPILGKVWLTVKSVSEWLISVAPWPF